MPYAIKQFVKREYKKVTKGFEVVQTDEYGEVEKVLSQHDTRPQAINAWLAKRKQNANHTPLANWIRTEKDKSNEGR